MSKKLSVLDHITTPRPLRPVAGMSTPAPAPEPLPLAGNRTDLDALSEAAAAVPQGASDFDRLVAKTAPVTEQRFTLRLGADLAAVIDGSGIKDGTLDVRHVFDGFSIQGTIRF